MRKLPSGFDRSRAPTWWSQAVLRAGHQEVQSDAVIDTGSAYTVIPMALLQDMGLKALTFDGPLINSVLGSGRSAVVRVNIGLIDLDRTAEMDAIVPESTRPDFDFVIIGIDFLDKVGALLQFGPQRQMAGVRPPQGVPFIEILTPIFEGD